MSCYFILIYLFLVEICLASNEIKTKYITQKLDHFSNSSSFQMLYFERLSYWKPKGPIFVYVNGEYGATDRYVKRGGMVRLAMLTHGAMFVIEHRYYGKSIPAVKMYDFLNSKQVLADLAHFIRTIKQEKRFWQSKVVLIGVSYSGSLASWARQKYPELIDAAWASSAPVLAKFEFSEYYESLGQLYRKYGGNDCYEKIANVFKHQSELIEMSVEQFKKEHNICDDVDLSQPTQKQVYFNRLISKYDQNKKADKIVEMCEKVNKSMNSKGKCDGTRFEYVLPRNVIDIAWAWQCCTEFGFFITNPSNRKPFFKNIPIEFPIEKCKIFGKYFNRDIIQKTIDNTNNAYGGKRPNVTRVVYVNGGLDAWSRLGIINNISDDAPAIFLKNQGHGDDFKPIKPGDSRELSEARNIIKVLIKKWIS